MLAALLVILSSLHYMRKRRRAKFREIAQLSGEESDFDVEAEAEVNMCIADEEVPPESRLEGRQLYCFVALYVIAVVAIVVMFEVFMPVVTNPNYPNYPKYKPKTYS